MIASAKVKSAKTLFTPDTGSIELLIGDEVLQLLEDASFQVAWDHLCNICPWTTIFQRSSFVATWYRIYEKEFFPILVKAENAGKLTGLLTLAAHKNGLITGAGANQAEYQAWLTADAKDEQFIKNALQEVDLFFPGKNIVLKYIPVDVPLGFTKKDPIWHKRCFVKTSPHPLMIINDAHLTNELRKKNRREKINRLKRLGELKFERISDYAAFLSVFDEMAIQSDFRKGAMYNKVAFKTDPLRKKFLLSLFEQNNLHVTVIKINDTIIASNASIGGLRQLHLQGLNSFDAAYARYSPGIIHFLMLGKLLAEEGVEVFDLTPGGDAYKDILATDYTEAYTLSIGNNYHGVTNRFKLKINRYFKNKAATAGVKHDTLRKWKRKINFYNVKLKKVTRQGFPSLFAGLLGKLKRRKKATECWVVQKDLTYAGSGLINIQKDNCKDLLDFDQQEVRYSQQEFLSDAMHRFEEGAHCYSWVKDGVLLGCAWVTNLKPATDESGNSKIEGWGISLSGLYCHPGGRQQYADFIKAVAAEVAIDSPSDKFYIVTACDDDDLFEKAGFQPYEVTK
jgi:CelD/BcsL family acetyltransferase involved in cellulose biosynthesis